MKPFSQACENNKQPIYQALQRWLKDSKSILEVGSGTGQHAVYFGTQFPHITWQSSDFPANHAGIQQWLDGAQLNNILSPIALDVRKNWGDACSHKKYDAVFSSNTLHIMAWKSVSYFFEGAASCLAAGGLLFVYGPFNYEGKFTSESNQRFNNWLKQQNPDSAIRDVESVNKLAQENGFMLQEDNAMPANNRLLIWKKTV